MTQRRRQVWRKWRKLVSEQSRSGQSVAAFCRKRGLCAPHFFQWKKRLSQATAPQFVEVKVTAAAEPNAASGSGIEIRLNHDRCLVVQPGFDAKHLQALLAVLENRA